jgi:LacI family transcriptional regulator
VAAIILAASEDPLASLEHARQQHIPVIAIDRFVAAEVDQVACESVEATAQLVDHLAQIGHQRIAMISGKPGLGTTKDRVRGFRLGMRRNGLRVNAGLIVPGNSQDDIAHEAMTRLLRRSAPPTAVVVGNNRMTIGAVRAARDSGVDIPGDLALVGFDDFEWADLFHPGLTVIAQPTAALCRQAVELVMSRLTDPGAPVRRVALQPTFVHRESCGCR